MLKKRLTSIFLSIFIVIGVVASDYCTVMAADIPTAFWGTLEASRAWFTAMQAGGAFDRGISFNQFVNTTSEQWQEVERKTMQAFKLYLFYRYQIDVTEKFPNMTVEEVRQEALRLSNITYNSFMEKAINVSDTTKEGITVQDFKYWKEFCKEFSSVSKNGLGSGELLPNTVINTVTYNPDNVAITSQKMENLGENCFSYNDHYYVYKGKFFNQDFDYSNVPTDRVRIPFAYMFCSLSSYNCWKVLEYIDVNRLTGDVITRQAPINSYVGGYSPSVYNQCNAQSNLPLCFFEDKTSYIDYTNNLVNNYAEKLSVSVGQSALDWQYEIDDSLKNTAGTSIKDGNAQQKSKEVVREGSVPVKRSSLKEEEKEGSKVVSGVIGWDIPKTEVIEAGVADPKEENKTIEDMGIIDVPAEEIENPDIPGEVIIPGEAEVVVPDEPIPIPIPISDIFKIQYGPFYPTSMDITEFFPFCIPFDFAYCVNKFRVGEGEAPVIDFPIVYPKKLQPILGESYHVIIDFNDYIFLRNIIRYFLLLSFITGLMFATRSLIRG